MRSLRKSCNACMSPLFPQRKDSFRLLHSFHPDFHQRSSAIQREMLEYMKSWVQGLGSEQRSTLARLSKQSVRAQENTRGGQSGGGGGHAHQAPAQGQQSIQGFMQGIPGVPQMQGLMNMAGGAGIGREVVREQSISHYSRPEISTSYGTTATSTYAPPPGPPQSASGYAPSYVQPPQSEPPYRAQSHYTSSYAQPTSPASFPRTSSPYGQAQGAPGGYAPSVPSPGIPSAGSYSSSAGGGYSSAGGYSSMHSPPVSSYAPPSGPPPGDFGGFPDERHGMHGHGPGPGHGHGHGHAFPEAPAYGGRQGPPQFPDEQFGSRHEQEGPFPPGRGRGYPPRDEYDRRW
jgi:hypothetical protein